jgi:hypothetical protein
VIKQREDDRRDFLDVPAMSGSVLFNSMRLDDATPVSSGISIDRACAMFYGRCRGGEEDG